MNYILAKFVVKYNTSVKKNMELFYLPYSNVNIKIVKLLFSYRCIRFFSVELNQKTKILHIKIVPVYLDSKSIIKNIELLSRPGLRIFWSAKQLAFNYSRNNFQGFYVLTTPSGICSSHELVLTPTLDRPIAGEVLLKINL